MPWERQGQLVSEMLAGRRWKLMLLGLGGGGYWFTRWHQTVEGRASWDARVLTMPVIGPLVVMVSVARLARTLGTLLRSGVPLLSAMDITRGVLTNVQLQAVLDDARDAVREGESIAQPLKRSGKFPPIVTHMIAIGERSGELEAMLEHLASAYETQIDARVSGLTSLLEPLMIVMMGGSAAFIAFSILMPLLQINEFIQ